MARETGLEPATSGVTGRRSNQLSYSRSGKLNSSAQRVVDVPGTPCQVKHPHDHYDDIFPTAALPVENTFCDSPYGQSLKVESEDGELWMWKYGGR